MKVLLRFLVLGGILGVLAIVLVSLSVNALLKSGIETMGPKLLGVPVTLEDVDLSLLSGGTTMRVSLTQLIIKNPAGYETAYAASFPNVRVEVDWNSVLTDTIMVEEVRLVEPAMIFEGSLQASNLSKIRENVKRTTGSDDNGDEKGETHENGAEPDKTVHIKKMTVKDAGINVNFLGGRSQTIQFQVLLPDFELRDIGDPSGGTTLKKALAEIFNAMYRAIIKAVTKSGKLTPEGVEQLGQSVEKLGKQLLKGLLKH